jgi:hypothetical protein
MYFDLYRRRKCDNFMDFLIFSSKRENPRIIQLPASTKSKIHSISIRTVGLPNLTECLLDLFRRSSIDVDGRPIGSAYSRNTGFDPRIVGSVSEPESDSW